jgi:hypothetical protein
MFAPFGARFAAVVSACGQHCKAKCRTLAAAAMAGLLSACVPATVPLLGKDPADPAVRVGRVGYRSTIAPYTSLRPSTPAPWRERSDSAAPLPKQDH